MFSFRTKLLLAMLFVVAGVGVTILLVTQRRVQQNFEEMYRRQFHRQLEYFTSMQDSRLETTREQCLKLAQAEPVVSVLANSNIDATELYRVALSEFSDAPGGARGNQRNTPPMPGRRLRPGFERFINAEGKPIVPPEGFGGRRFAPATRSRLEAHVPFLAQALALPAAQQIAYMALETETNDFGGLRPAAFRQRGRPDAGPDDERRTALQEIIFTRITTADGSRVLGAFVYGSPMTELIPHPPTDRERGAVSTNQFESLHAGVLLQGHLYARESEMPEALGAMLAEAIKTRLERSTNAEGEFNILFEDTPYRVHFESMNPGSAFPPAHQVCIYSMADAEREKRALRWKVGVSSLAVFVVAVGLSLVISHGLAAPIRSLTAGTHEIAQGNLDVRLPVKSRDELGRLTFAFNEMAEGLALKERYRTVLDLVADEKVAHQLVHGDIVLGGERREVSVLFCDIRGFTALTQNMPPEQIIEMLNEHMTALTAVVKAHEGVLDKFVGDLLMAIFGAPVSHENDARNAARCALALIDSRRQLNAASNYKLEVGIGLASGTVVAGCMGSADRLNYTVLGERVNLASRLCSIAEAGEVLVDDATLARLNGLAQAEPKNQVTLKGFDAPVQAFRLRSVN